MPSSRTVVRGYRGGAVEIGYLILTTSMACCAKMTGKNAKIFESGFVVHGDDKSEAQPYPEVKKTNSPI